MKLCLKSGQIITLSDVHTIRIASTTYGVGKFYDRVTDDEYISRTNVFALCSRHRNAMIEFYYNMTKLFCTNTDNIVGVEV